MSRPDIVSVARALAAQHQKVKEIRDDVAAELIGELESGKVEVDYRNTKRYAELGEQEGIHDRLRRDLVHMLSREPLYLMSLVMAIEERARRDEGLPRPIMLKTAAEATE